MFPMQNFEPKSAMISASSNFALIEKYLRNTCLGQGAVPSWYTAIKANTQLSKQLISNFLHTADNCSLRTIKSQALSKQYKAKLLFIQYSKPSKNSTQKLKSLEKSEKNTLFSKITVKRTHHLNQLPFLGEDHRTLKPVPICK